MMKDKPIPSQLVLRSFFQQRKVIEELEAHKRGVDRFMFILGLISAAMAIPQIINIYMQKDSSQVSLAAWGFYSLSALLWIVYASIFKLQVTKRVNVLYLITNLLVVVMILMHR